MGMLMSYMGGTGEGLANQTLSLLMGTLYDQFLEKDIKDFETFHLAILDIFNTINIALPGKHYDPPSTKDVEGFFNEWKEFTGDRENSFTDFMKKHVNLNKVDDSLVITGILAPPAAMVAKRTGQIVPQLSVIKSIPDVIFVPSATIFALIAVKFSRIKLMKKVAS